MERITSYAQYRQLEANTALSLNSRGEIVKLNRWEAFCQKVGDLFRSANRIAARTEALQGAIRTMRMESRQAAATARPFAGPRDLTAPPHRRPATVTPQRLGRQQKIAVLGAMTAATAKAHPHATPQQQRALAGCAQAWIMKKISPRSFARLGMDTETLSRKLLALYEKEHPEMAARLLGTAQRAPSSRKPSPSAGGNLSQTPSASSPSEAASGTAVASPPRKKHAAGAARPERQGTAHSTPRPGQSTSRSARAAGTEAALRTLEKRTADLASGVKRMGRQVEAELHAAERKLQHETRKLDHKLEVLSDMMADPLGAGMDDMDEQVQAVLRELEAHQPSSRATASALETPDDDAEYAELLREAESEMEEPLDDSYAHLNDGRLLRNIGRETKGIDSALSSSGLLSTASMGRIEGHVTEIGKNASALLLHSREQLRQAHVEFEEAYAPVQDAMSFLAAPLSRIDDAEIEAELERLMREQR